MQGHAALAFVTAPLGAATACVPGAATIITTFVTTVQLRGASG